MAYFATCRYGKMLLIGKFKRDRNDLRKREKCVVRTERGKEVGELLTTFEPIPEGMSTAGMGTVLRRASDEDYKALATLEEENNPREISFFKEHVKELKLPMKLLQVDHLLGSERIIFYFTSDTRVDFRELVRRLASEFRTRIELKQIGARDQARLVGDVGHCGLDLCCRSHLKDLGGITMDMAKIQKHTADPSKITGRCGKLLCCLRYEYAGYKESRKMLPSRGADVLTKEGVGRVVQQNFLLRELTVEMESNGDLIIVKAADLEGAPKRVAGCTGCATKKLKKAPEIRTHVRNKIEKDTMVRSITQDPPEFRKVAKVDQIPVGHGLPVIANSKPIAIFNLDGTYHAVQGDCPHQGGALGESKLDGTDVVCPLHKWRFDLKTGAYKSVGTGNLRVYEVKVEGDHILVKA